MNPPEYQGKISMQYENDLHLIMYHLRVHPIGIIPIVSRDHRGGKVNGNVVSDIMPVITKDVVFDVKLPKR